MKNIKARAAKTLLILFIFVLVAGLVGALVLLFLRTRELNSLKDSFTQATQQLNADNEDKQIRIEDLKTGFEELTSEVSALKEENTSLKQQVSELQSKGFGEIRGRIIPFVTTGVSDFSQYQRVCAELVTNKNSQYCRTVSALDQGFSFSVPAGKYNIYAELFPAAAPSSPFAGLKAYYSEYIKCVKEQGIEKCDANAKTPVVIEVKAGSRTDNIDPIDWRK